MIIENREVFVSALRVADRLMASKQRKAQVTTCSQAVSALSDVIDKQWKEVCKDSETWRKWWRAGKPRQLQYLPRLSPPQKTIRHPSPLLSQRRPTPPLHLPPNLFPLSSPPPHRVTLTKAVTLKRVPTPDRIEVPAPHKTPTSVSPGTATSGNNKQNKGSNKRGVKTQ